MKKIFPLVFIGLFLYFPARDRKNMDASGYSGTSAVNTRSHRDVPDMYERRKKSPFLSDSVTNNASTIFLLDRSGSMSVKGMSGKSKWEEAQEAALKATASILKSQNKRQQVAFLTFAGGCSPDPTATQPLNFSTSYQEVEQQMAQIGRPGGGTPLTEAVTSVKQRLQDYSANYGDGEASKLIVLSDGAATCAKIRPETVYGSGTTMITISGQGATNGNVANGNTGTKVQPPAPPQSTVVNGGASTGGNSIPIKYFTIGFDIKPGSAAERDLQFLAEQTGGKYMNTQNEVELTRAFTKFFKVYYPKPKTSIAGLAFAKEHVFMSGVEAIQGEEFRKAKELFENFVMETPADYNAIFNLALMYEANDFHLQAIEKFEEYLSLYPQAEDKDWVLDQILLLQNDMLQFFEYTREILTSDLEYLDTHFKKIQDGEGRSLANEFKGFIQEKEVYYEELPLKLGVESKIKRRIYSDIKKGLSECSRYIRKDPDNWDTNATSPLSLIHFNLEKLIANF